MKALVYYFSDPVVVGAYNYINDIIIFLVEDAAKQTDTKIDTPPLVAMDAHALEEQSIVQSIIDVLQPGLETEDDVGMFLEILRDVFPLSTKPKTMYGQFADTKLVNAVQDQLNEDNVKETQEIMDKVG
jgi:hypothetical protein